MWLTALGVAKRRKRNSALIACHVERYPLQKTSHILKIRVIRLLFQIASFISKVLATPEGFEPPTYRLGICRSILLSYGAAALI